MAPEVIEAKQSFDDTIERVKSITSEADIFSFARVFYEVCNFGICTKYVSKMQIVHNRQNSLPRGFL